MASIDPTAAVGLVAESSATAIDSKVSEQVRDATTTSTAPEESLIGHPDPEAQAALAQEKKPADTDAGLNNSSGPGGNVQLDEDEVDPSINWGFDDMEELLDHEVGPYRPSEEHIREQATTETTATESSSKPEIAQDTPTVIDNVPQGPGVDVGATGGHPAESRSFPDDYFDESGTESRPLSQETDQGLLESMFERLSSPAMVIPEKDEPTTEKPEEPVAPVVEEPKVEEAKTEEPTAEALMVEEAKAVEELTAGVEEASPESPNETNSDAATPAAAMSSEVQPPSDRHEEGLPLLAAASNQTDGPAAPAREDAAGIDPDDFFDNLSQNDEIERPHLERKTTEAAMGLTAEEPKADEKVAEPEEQSEEVEVTPPAPAPEPAPVPVATGSKPEAPESTPAPSGDAFEDDFFDNLDAEPENEDPKPQEPSTVEEKTEVPKPVEQKPEPPQPVEQKPVKSKPIAAATDAFDDDDSFFDHLDEPVEEETKSVEAQTFPQTSAATAETKPVASAGDVFDDDFFDHLGEPEAENTKPAPPTSNQPSVPDAFAEDPEDAFLEDDDDEFLPSDDEAQSAQPAPPAPAPGSQARYQPPAQPQAGQNYFPQQPATQQYAPQQNQWPAPAAPPGPPRASSAAPESFVNKHSGYHSPYDLPADLTSAVKVRRKASFPAHPYNAAPSPAINPYNPAPAIPGQLPPPRSTSIGAVSPGFPPPIGAPPLQRTGTQGSFSSRPGTSSGQAGTPASATPSFFEELPVVSKPKAPSRYAPSPQPPAARPGSVGNYPMASQFAPPPGAPPGVQTLPVPAAPAGRYSPSPVARNSAYAPPPAPAGGPLSPPPVQAQLAQPGAPAGYPTPPPTAQSAPPVAATSRYASVSNAPSVPSATASRYAPPPKQAPTAKPSGQYAPPPPTRSVSNPTQFAKPPVGTTPPPHQQQRQVSNPIFASPPRNEEGFGAHPPRHAPEMHQLHSARPTTGRTPLPHDNLQAPNEEDELSGGIPEGSHPAPPSDGSITNPVSPTSTSMPPPSRFPNRSTATPPPTNGFGNIGGTLSPPKVRAQSPRYTPSLPQRQMSAQYPARAASPQQSFVPPPRAQTQSPSAALNGPIRSLPPKDPYRRPSSALANAYQPSPGYQQPKSAAFVAPLPELQPPMDASAHDPLARWQGAPVFKWGVGGNIVSMFPKRVQRFTAEANGPMTKSFPGEVKIKQVKDYLSPDETLTTFPGPLVNGGKGNKTKKKDVLSWVDSHVKKIEESDKNEFGGFNTTEVEEKVLLWKIVKLLVENDGVLEGTPELEKAVRAILWPEGEKKEDENTLPYASASQIANPASIESASPSDLREIKEKLLSGDRTAAVWHAVDKRLWSHALVIASTASKDIWKQVVQEFVKNEVKSLGAGCESISTLYEIFAGSGADAIDELVPQSARMGLPMLNRQNTSQIQSSNPLESLRLWRETLTLIVSNRSPNDVESILGLGRLLKSYNRIDAAQICFIFARQLALWTGADDAKADFVLLGADHSKPEVLGKDLESVLLSEIYEYALSLPATVTVSGIPHLQIFKLYHAQVLVQNGHANEAQKYCESIAAILRAATGKSPYYQATLFAALDDLTQRLQEAPKDSTGSLSKLSLDNVSGSIWGAFYKFAAGDEEDKNKTDLDSPFAKASPSISRSESQVDMFSAYNSYAGPQTAYGSMSSQYGPPSGVYNPRTSSESQRYGTQPKRSSSLTRGAYEPQGPYGSSYEQKTPMQPPANYGPYTPTTNQGYNPPAHISQNGAAAYSPGYPPQSQQQQQQKFGNDTPARPSFESPLRNSFEPSAQNAANTAEEKSEEPPAQSYGGYEPPSYEPPTYQPYQPEPESDDEKPKPKKKGIMDDDDDEFDNAALRKMREEEQKKKEAESKKKEEKKDNDGDANAAGQQKSGWFGGWFRKKDDTQPKAIKAKLGEESSFYYDPELKRWVNKKAGSDTPAPTSTPPPPRASPAISRPPSAAPSDPGPPPRPSLPQSSTAPPGGPPTQTLAPPMGTAPPKSPSPAPPPPMGSTPISGTPPPPPASAPPGPSKPPGGGDIMDELLGPPGARAKGTVGRKGKRGGRYVDVMAK